MTAVDETVESLYSTRPPLPEKRLISRSHNGREAVKMPVYMPWPQSGRMQYEKIKNEKEEREPGLSEGGRYCESENNATDF
jgi:hypothetical protein